MNDVSRRSNGARLTLRLRALRRAGRRRPCRGHRRGAARPPHQEPHQAAPARRHRGHRPRRPRPGQRRGAGRLRGRRRRQRRAEHLAAATPTSAREILVEAGIPLVDDVGPEVFAKLQRGRRGPRRRRHALPRRRGRRQGHPSRPPSPSPAAMDEAKAGPRQSSSRRSPPTRWSTSGASATCCSTASASPTSAPRSTGGTSLIVVRGYHYREDLATLRPYIREYRPVLIGVDGGADALLEAGYRPDLIVGDMDSVSDDALTLRRRDRRARLPRRPGARPGAGRSELGSEAVVFPATGTSEDVAMLLADDKGAALIVAVGTHATLVEFLDKGRAGMASTFLTRLRVGSKLVDAKGVSRLYRSRISTLGRCCCSSSARSSPSSSRSPCRPAGDVAQSPARRPLARLRLLADRTLHVIDFRYHLVSIVAIFLALALGIVLGSTTLSDSVSDTLRQQANQAAKTAQQARTQQRQLQDAGQRAGAVRRRHVAADRRRPAQGPVGRDGRGAGRRRRQHRAGQRAGQERRRRRHRTRHLQKKLLDDDQQMHAGRAGHAAQDRRRGVPRRRERLRQGGRGARGRAGHQGPRPLRPRGRRQRRGPQRVQGRPATSPPPASPASTPPSPSWSSPAAPYAYEGGGDDNEALISLAAALDAAGRGTVVGGPVDLRAGGRADRGAARLRGRGARLHVDVVDTPSGQVVDDPGAAERDGRQDRAVRDGRRRERLPALARAHGGEERVT